MGGGRVQSERLLGAGVVVAGCNAMASCGALL